VPEATALDATAAVPNALSPMARDAFSPALLGGLSPSPPSPHPQFVLTYSFA